MSFDFWRKPVFWLVALIGAGLALLLVGIMVGDNNGVRIKPLDPTSPIPGPKVDDWVYEPLAAEHDGYVLPSGVGFSGAEVSSESIGFAVGGAKDIDNFRRNIAEGYLPAPADISHEGLFYDYFFETSLDQPCDQLFCPSYAAAVSADPFSGEPEHFLAVGLNSNISSDDFARKNLNLVVVLDISGSMSSSFNSYYYDSFSGSFGDENPQPAVSKMEVANESLVALLDHLRPEDRLGIVLFDQEAYKAKDLRLVGETDIDAIKEHILEVTPQGGTNMEAGYALGTELFDEYRDADPETYENRIIFLTDAMPNIGSIDEDHLSALAADNADQGIYTTFIGVGLDFNAELVREITSTKGANYYSVHSSEEFKQRLDEGFEYMVTPLVFDLTLELDAEGYDIRAVYGSPEADLATGRIMAVNTLFPSLRVDGETRGGLILLHLDKTSEQADLDLSVTYDDRVGRRYESRQTVEFPAQDSDYFADFGIRKGIILARLVNGLRDWLVHEESSAPKLVDYERSGIPIIEVPKPLNDWERTSKPLVLSPDWRPVISDLQAYISAELPVIGDESLVRELELLELILDAPAP